MVPDHLVRNIQLIGECPSEYFPPWWNGLEDDSINLVSEWLDLILELQSLNLKHLFLLYGLPDEFGIGRKNYCIICEGPGKETWETLK